MPSHAWLEAIHIIAVVCWFAALFYLPRLFVYHAMAEDSVSIERFKIMERKLYWGIGTPAMVLTLLFGLGLVASAPSYYLGAVWFHVKATLVLILIGYHIACGFYLKVFRDDRNRRNHVFFRWFNEFPVILLVGIVIMVVVKPFH